MWRGMAIVALAGVAVSASAQVLSPDAPSVGDVVPNVTVYDAEGEPVTLHGLEGKYRVLVFGCLT